MFNNNSNITLKTLILIISTSIFKQSRSSLKSTLEKKWNKQYINGAIYLLYFFFFILNVSYFIFFNKQKYNSFKALMLFFQIFSLNILMWKFFLIGRRFVFKKIIRQELFIFKELFTKNLNKKFFKETILEDENFNRKYYFLKFIYKNIFFTQLQKDLIKIILYFNWVYFFLFSFYWIYAIINNNLINTQIISSK